MRSIARWRRHPAYVRMIRLDTCLNELAATLSDEQLERELKLAQHAALLSVRTSREFALRRLSCLQRELQRRAVQRRPDFSLSASER